MRGNIVKTIQRTLTGTRPGRRPSGPPYLYSVNVYNFNKAELSPVESRMPGY